MRILVEAGMRPFERPVVRNTLIALTALGFIGVLAIVHSRGGISLSSTASAANEPIPFKPTTSLEGTSGYPSSGPALRITEIHLGADEVWAELYCARGPVDLRRYSLSDLDGSDLQLAKDAATLQTGDFVVAHWSEGQSEVDALGDLNRNGVRDLYIGERPAPDKPIDRPPSRNVDQLALIENGEGGGAYLDAVAWCAPGYRAERWEHDDMVTLEAQNMWAGQPLEAASLDGASWVLRDIREFSRNSAQWALSPVATPGMGTDQANIPKVGSVILTEANPLAPSQEAFAEIRCERTAPAEGVNLQAFVLTDLDGEATPLASQNFTLKPGEYAVVRWSNSGITECDHFGDRNRNGVRDIYLPAKEAPARTADVLVLALGGQIYDAIGWRAVGAISGEAFAKDLATLKARGAEVPVFDLGGPELLLARADGPWFVSSITSPGGASRLATAPPKGALLLSEVYPAGGQSWVEIEASPSATEPIDASLFVLSSLDGRGEPLARDPLTLQPGARVIIRWGQGVDEVDAVGDANGNGVREVYLEKTGSPSSTTDQVVLAFGSEIHDALAWTSPDKEPTEAEKSDMARLREQIRGLTVVKRADRASVARVNGRVLSLADPTPGLANDHYLSRPFGRVQMTAFKVAREEAWAEITCMAGPTDISRLIVTDMDDQDAPLSEAPITLARGQKARVMWGRGESETDEVGDANGNGIREIYLDQDKPTKSGDQIVLIHNGRMLDAVVFSDWENARFSYPEQDDVKRLVAERLWRAADPALPSAVTTSGGVCQRAGQGWRRAEG